MSGNENLDLTFLFEIADGSNEFIVESIDMFMQQTPDLLNVIEKSIADSDWQGVGASAHKLKPNLGFFGMNDCQGYMQDIENMAKTQFPDANQLSAKFGAAKAIVTGNMPKLQQIKATAEANL